jgi:hypothetical protein
MRKFIRSKKTNAFLTEKGNWTSDVESAFEFYNDNQIREAYASFRLKACELYYCFGTKPSHLDFSFPLALWLKAFVIRRRKNHGERTR